MEHVLVTGGAGYIGSACVEYLLDLGYKVTVFDALLTGHRDAVDPRAEFIKGHLADREGIIALCRERGFRVETGEFGADMLVASVNDGPVTILLET